MAQDFAHLGKAWRGGNDGEEFGRGSDKCWALRGVSLRCMFPPTTWKEESSAWARMLEKRKVDRRGESVG